MALLASETRARRAATALTVVAALVLGTCSCTAQRPIEPAPSSATTSAESKSTPASPAAGSNQATASTTLTVNLDRPLRPVTHVASGGLYGLADDRTPSDADVTPLHPNTFVQMAPGGRQLPNREPTVAGDALVVAAKAARVGAKVIIRMPDWYPAFPYRWVSWSDWLHAVGQQVKATKASGATNVEAYELWNEPDGTWDTTNAGDFDTGWARTFNAVRAIDSTTPIDGPSISHWDAGYMESFLTDAKAANAIPDIVSWHELTGDSTISADVTSYRSMESSLGITTRPIVIEEYGTPDEVGVPGALVGYIAKFERAGVANAELAFWNQYGTLGDLLTTTGGARNGAWWLYKWYGDMAGEMVSTVPPAQFGIDGAAAVDARQRVVSVIFGGGAGATAVTVNGLDALSFTGARARVHLEYTPSPGRTIAVSATNTILDEVESISSGTITVPIAAMDPTAGYHLVITPS